MTTKYMNEETFTKLTKKQKLDIKPEDSLMTIKCSKVLFLPIKRKMDGFGMSACFLKTEKGWIRVGDYDCFRFYEPKYRVRGDFEYGGIQFFSENGFIYDYGNEFICN